MTSPLQRAAEPADVVDRIAALAAGSVPWLLRHERDKVGLATQGSYDALFDPALAGLSLAERLLVALYASRLTPSPPLAAHYRHRLEADGADADMIGAVAAGSIAQVAAPRLQALLAFTQKLVERPIDGDRAALRALRAAGIETPAVVTLAQLIAFLSYQVRLVASLEAMRADPGSVAKERPPGPPGAVELPDLPSARGFTIETLGWTSWLDVVDLAAATPEQIAVLEESHPQAKASDYYRTLVHQPQILRQRSAAFNAIMYAPGGLPRAERELAATVVSRLNGCVYCASVHAQRFEQLAKRRDVIEQVFADPRRAGTTDRERAIVRFSIELTATPQQVSAESIRALEKAGLGGLEVLDLVHSIAIFAWANRLMLNLGEPVRPAPAA
jgi:uncharacterized peroxidase-related enzyme